MLTKHFFKTLVLFSCMILAGLVGVFLVGHFAETDKESASDVAEQVAE